MSEAIVPDFEFDWDLSPVLADRSIDPDLEMLAEGLHRAVMGGSCRNLYDLIGCVCVEDLGLGLSEEDLSESFEQGRDEGYCDAQDIAEERIWDLEERIRELECENEDLRQGEPYRGEVADA